MRKAAVTAGLLRPKRAYALLWQHECDVLDSLAPWMTRLFLHLVRISDFSSGAGSTTFAQLVLLMAPIQPARGPRLFVPDEQACRRAVLSFEKSRILARDKGASEDARLLFFLVLDRRAEVRPSLKLDGLTRRGVDNPKTQQRRRLAADDRKNLMG